VKRQLVGVLCAVVLAASAASCTSRDPATLTVFAAASLTESFAAIASDFQATHPGVRVQLSFGPSDGLAAQIGQGAPADVYASASARWMDAVANDPGARRCIDVGE
jgi:molybdate transport system substrate-binding protein